MPNKNSLESYKNAPDEPRIFKKKGESKKPAKKTEKRGRKPKDTASKEDKVVALKLTDAEKKALEKKAGITPVATFLKHFLRTETDIFG